LSELHKFIFEGLAVRGMLVRLTDGWQQLLRRREQAGTAFEPPVRTLLGELAAAATLMQANIKFDGALVLQVQGDGPVKLAVAEVKSDLVFRVTATVVGDVAPGASLEAMVNLHGKGRCAITLDPQDKLPGRQPYQGIVPLFGDRREPLQKIGEVLEHYMLQSEQLDTRLILAANDDVAAGLLIQRLPEAGHASVRRQAADRDDAYHRIALLAATLTREELLTLSADTLLHRLFWEEPLRRFEPLAGASGPRFACSCSRERVGNMLKSLGAEEVDGIVVEQGRVEVACEFCGKQYHYDAVDVGELFTPPIWQPPGSSALN
jgi:molecular chaperone Hsp33